MLSISYAYSVTTWLCYLHYCVVLWYSQIIEYIKDWWLYSFVCKWHFSLAALCKCIWQYSTSKMLVRYILSSVCLRLSWYSQLSYIWYIWGCVYSANTFFYDGCENRCILHCSLWSQAQMYEAFAMKQWYALYVFLCWYCNYCNDISTQ